MRRQSSSLIAISAKRRDGSCARRAGLNRLELVVTLVIAVICLAIAAPGVVTLRESARRIRCVNNLKTLGAALRQYHDTHQCLPPAAIWRPGNLNALMLDQNRRIDLFTYENWAQLLLPYVGREDLAHAFDSNRPVAAVENRAARTTSVTEMMCPTDYHNETDNFYMLEPYPDARDKIAFARGNYAINGGTHCHRSRPGTSARPRGDGLELIIDEEHRTVRYIGSGVTAINHSFSFRDFVNGQSTLVAIDEIRAGIHPLDPRGVWSLGQIGGSITWGHGVTGDDGGPNNQDERADDILGCGRLHELLGKETLMEEHMPCVHYIDRNDQATSRSLHSSGVNVAFMDGAVRFIDDRVDRGLWHVMHTRETPLGVLADEFETRLNRLEPPTDRAKPTAPHAQTALVPGTLLANSIGMNFVAIPAGEFQMGVPDSGYAQMPPPPESPMHLVRITRNFWMGQTEVTQSAFEKILGFNPSFHRPSDDKSSEASHFPVEQVTWTDAEEFCRLLSDLPAERATGRHYRLPTEAEWEYSCRAGKSESYGWRPSAKNREKSGENGGLEPALPVQPVGSYPLNDFKLYDMRGNVWEWCADWFDRSYYSRSPAADPQGPATGYLKVLRGNDWIYVGEACRINFPLMPPWKRNPFVGFRVVCEVDE